MPNKPLPLLLPETGLQHLAGLIKPGILCVFDFDGTLAPIVSKPEQAHLSLAIRHRLLELRGIVTTAVITGRSLKDIRAQMDYQPDYLIGNHGLEGLPGWEHRRQEYEEHCAEWKTALAAALQDTERFPPGVWIEDKTCSLSVHYRFVREREKIEPELIAFFASLAPQPRVVAGKCVFNLLPKNAPNKGSALEELIRLSGAVSTIYIGDDVGDEEVFKLQRQDLVTVRIERLNSSAARYFLRHQVEVIRLLDELIRRLGKSSFDG